MRGCLERLLGRRYSKASGGLFDRASDSSAHNLCLSPAPLGLVIPTEELMIAPHTQELVRPKKGSCWVGPVRGVPMRGGVATREVVRVKPSELASELASSTKVELSASIDRWIDAALRRGQLRR
jgi:hypothetical protein